MVPMPMSMPAAGAATLPPLRGAGTDLRVAFVGPRVWLDACALVPAGLGMDTACFDAGPGDPPPLRDLSSFGADVTVVLDPPAVGPEALAELAGLTLGVLVRSPAVTPDAPLLASLDRLVCFDPAATGASLGRSEIWRAIPPPVSDCFYREVRPRLHHAPRAMSVGRSSTHREAMLIAAKHHYDLLQVIHGVSGEPLAELLGEYDVGVYACVEPGGGFGQQIGMHLAAGQLLMAEHLSPTHGLERNIDYLHFDSPDGLAWLLERLGRFPEMHHAVRVRGRLKAEQYRASRVFARLLHDLLHDVPAFGAGRRS
jgi:hypothetical protein